MTYRETTTKLNGLRGQITAIRAEMRQLQQQIEPDEVADHVFHIENGQTSLSQLFGVHRQLVVIHNMGAGCAYCTMWADGYNGLYEHIADRAAFVLVSPDAPDKQRKFATSRGWRFPMVSDSKSEFAQAMGYAAPDGRPMPGISVFQMDGKRIQRVSDTGKGPYDDFCPAWHLFDLLPDGAAGWQPKLKYPAGHAA